MNSKYFNYLFLILGITLLSCGDDVVRTPKPHMYPRIFFPEKTGFTVFDTSFCKFEFRYPNYAKIVQDSIVHDDEPAHPCWFDIAIPSLNASLYCSYYDINKEKALSKLINDAFNIADKHNIKANYRKESIIENEYGVKGMIFDIEGPVASPVQFYLTDEKHHFFRASLYFNSKVNPDSTAPVLQFLQPDIDSIISSFKWKN
ncbi:MAG: hypothetical protein J5I52_08085 [Saprospiraceae bacterium]|nr:MAG: gliding motility protein GldD [Bacteroidetes bacterium OLB9]MCO6464094.1 hypothetical protein [Saprospiraceae bacterium]MCZ2339077.1 hypothetical protein [Chitinophagales bacterium]